MKSRRILFLALLVFLAATVSAYAMAPPGTGVEPTYSVPVTVRFHGPVQAVGPARWHVAGKMIEIDPTTTIDEPDGPTTAGMWAQVEAAWEQQAPLRARHIETAAEPPVPSGTTVSFTSVIDDISPESWRFGSTVVLVTAETVIVGQPAVGELAFVVARLEDDLLVAQIVVVIPAGYDPFFAEGELMAFDDALWRIRMGSDELLLNLSDQSVILGTPVVGHWVETVAVLEAGDVLTALFAEVTDPASMTVSFSGRLILQIDATSPEQWVVLVPDEANQQWEARHLIVNRANTMIDESGGPIVEGAWISVLARPADEAGGDWIARQLAVEVGPQQEVEGTIEVLGEGALPEEWRVGANSVIVDAATSVDGRPMVGRHALVRGTFLDANTIWASQIRVRYRFFGRVVARADAMTPRLWTIEVATAAGGGSSSKVFLLIDDTTYVDPSVEEADLGVSVEVQARATPNGWLAEKVLDFSDPS